MNQYLSNLFIVAVATFMLSSCGLITLRDDLPPEQIESNIYVLSREVTILAINKIYEDDVDEKVKSATVLSKRIESFVLPLLSNPDVQVDRNLEGQLFDVIPEEYRPLMAIAYTLFNTYYSFPKDIEFLPEPQLSYLRAFLTGIKDGADFVLRSNEVSIDNIYSIRKVVDNG